MKRKIISSAKKFGMILAAIFCIFFSYLIYGVWISKNTVVLQYEEYETFKVEDPLRIFFLSDLHDFRSRKFEEELKRNTAKLKPDLIVMGGDMINSETSDFSYLLNLIKSLPGTVPIVYVPGNEELDNPNLEGLITELGKRSVYYLNRDYIELQLKNQSIRLGGLYDYSFALDGEATPDPNETNPQVSQFLKDFQKTGDLKIMAHHRPDSFVFSSEPDYWNIDFTMAGHAHGGQVVLPFKGGLWAPDQGWFPEYIHGKYQLDALTTFITSGISTGKEILPRFNNPMEIMVIDINPKDSFCLNNS